MTKYGIIYKPTKEYVSFYDNGKAVLFTSSEAKVNEELFNLLYTDGGYDGNFEDFTIVVVDTETNGSEFVKEDNIFVSKSLVEDSLKKTTNTSENIKSKSNSIYNIQAFMEVLDTSLYNRWPDFNYVLNYDKIDEDNYIIYVNNLEIIININDNIKDNIDKVSNAIDKARYNIKENMSVKQKSEYIHKLENILIDELGENVNITFMYIGNNIYEVVVDGISYLINLNDDVYDNASKIIEKIKF